MHHGQDFAHAYLDDIVICSDSWSSHLHHIREVLKRIRVACFKLNRIKCVFGCAVIEYLDHRIGLGLVEPGQVKVKAMLEFQRPHTRKQLQSFLGLVGYFRKWIHITARLFDMMKKNIIFRWSPEAEQAFVALTSSLATNPILRPNDEELAVNTPVVM